MRLGGVFIVPPHAARHAISATDWPLSDLTPATVARQAGCTRQLAEKALRAVIAETLADRGLGPFRADWHVLEWESYPLFTEPDGRALRSPQPVSGR